MADYAKKQAILRAKKSNSKLKSSPSPRSSPKQSFVIKKEVTEHDSDGIVSEDEEDEEDYRTGGYHPIRIGDQLGQSGYTIVKKLGWGHFSTVWLALDPTKTRYVAMKVVKSAKHYTEAARDEIGLLECVAKSAPHELGVNYVVELVDQFSVSGPHGKLLGENLLTWIRRYDHRGLPVSAVKRIARQILLGLDYLHRCCEIIHTDLKPENVLMTITMEKLAKKFGVRPLTSLGSQRASRETLTGLASPRMSASTSHLERSMSSISIEQDAQEAVRAVSKKRPQSPSDMDPSASPSKRANSPMKKLGQPNGHEIVSGGGASGSNSSNNHHQYQQQPPANMYSQSPLIRASSASTIKSQTSLFSQPLSFQCKIADLGNACYRSKHFTQDIQTRQYRSPEVILGQEYDTPADLWSMACLVFELLTGDFLFDPHHGDKFSKDDDHLAQMIELLGPFSSEFLRHGKFVGDYFHSNGNLKHIKKLKYWSLVDVLREKYEFTREESQEISSFLLPMLQFEPDRRATAQEMLKHSWLRE